MASTFTPALRAELMGQGDQADTWGLTANATYRDVFEQAIAGLAAISMGNANITLTALNNAPDQSRPAILSITSSVALTAQRDVIVPSGAGVTKLWVVRNATTGGFAIRVKTAAGSGIVVPNGQTRLVYCDGTNVLASVTGAVAWTVDSGLTVTAGGLVVAAGGATVTGNSTVTGDLTVSGTLTAGALAGGATDLVPVGTIRATAGMAADSGWLYCNGAAQSRTTYASLFAKICRALVVDITNGSPTLVGVGLAVGFLVAGMPISGPGIPPGTTITLPINATTITLSANATATATGQTVHICPHGVGDGSTTFNVPDFRGVTLAGHDSMGAGSANRITTAGSGLNGIRIGMLGGSQLLAQHTHALTDPGHGHGVNDAGHSHGLTNASHQHGMAGAGGNVAYINAGAFFMNLTPPGSGGNYLGYGGIPPTDAGGGSLSVNGSGTGVSVQGNTTGISVQNAGTGTTANLQPTAIVLWLVKY